ncbi:MAG: nucleoside deaminase [Oscillospiraceae bacterium]|nr:nucleoside deaminase [Oscillospiraceae bacterium]
MRKEAWMREALREARAALETGDIPVGCIIVDGSGEIIARGRNRREAAHDATAHAEVEAIRAACARRESWRLEDCTLVVTLEPCPMCAGAILNARFGAVIYGAREEKTGSLGSVVDLYSENYGYHPRVYGGVLAEESAALLRKFFETIR